MLKVEHLNTGYEKKQVLYDVSFEIKEGDLALLIGSNGSGKSTLLKAIFGLIPLWDGEIFYKNQLLHSAQIDSKLKTQNYYVSGFAMYHKKTMYLNSSL